MDAAVRVFGGTGFNAAKIADIASEAGVATGTLYNYFSSKEEIFQSILEDGRDRIRAGIEACATIRDPVDRLHEVIRTMFDFLEENGALFMIHMQLGANPLDLKPVDDADEIFRHELLALLAGGVRAAGDRVRQDIPADTLAWVLGGLIHGAITQWIFGGCQPGLRTKADTIMDVFLNGAMPR